MELFTYKGIAEGKYVEGEIEALNQDEASHKLKEQKVRKKRLKQKTKVKKNQAFHFSEVKKNLIQKIYLFFQNNLQQWLKQAFQYWKFLEC